MEEDAIKESIEGYKQQLTQIDALLQCCDESNKQELINLKKDITDLIRITEESLLSLKKSRLLQELSSQEDASLKAEEENSCSSSSYSIKENDDNDDNESKFLGIKCKVRHTHDWGQTDYHNAMVLGTEETEDGDQKVKVLFMNPTHVSMLPCSYFLDGKCRFSTEKCRFSHGYLVDISDLEEYEEPDFSQLKEGEKCLAKYEDEIWYKATIKKIYDENIEIHYDTYNTDANVDMHNVLPIENKNYDYESSSDTSVDDDNSRDIHEENYVAQVSMTPLKSIGPIGEWETHTKGIGSKLMQKMGYVFGKGLGKDGEGRVEPIEIVILPAGKSLDKVAELREKGKLHKPLKKRKSKGKLGDGGKNQGGSTAKGLEQGTSVFEFINSKLTHSQGVNQSEDKDGHRYKVKHNIEDSYQQLKKIRKQKSKGESSSTKQAHAGPNWNVQLFKNNEKAMALKKQIAKQRESLKRNIGRDQEMVNRLKKSIDALEMELKDLENSGKTIENKLHSKKQHKKLTVF